MDYKLPVKELKCPECGCKKSIHDNFLGEGYRVCANCMQEWWTDIDYTGFRTSSNSPDIEEGV